ncbi:hypothetical protein F4775DRAFT_580206 [Biscogniauxia sp. FL1348]|nr:hypothetical protein F4775DRAFT_580206 [Biscogniauxia sp. FL1348]
MMEEILHCIRRDFVYLTFRTMGLASLVCFLSFFFLVIQLGYITQHTCLCHMLRNVGKWYIMQISLETVIHVIQCVLAFSSAPLEFYMCLTSTRLIFSNINGIPTIFASNH